MRMQLLITTTLFVSAAAYAADDRTFERQVQADPDGKVEISNVVGSVDVTGWDRPQVDVRGELDSDVERVDVSSEKGRTIIKVVLPNHSRGGEAALKIRVPKGCDLEVAVVNAPIRVRGVVGEQRLRSVSSDIDAVLGQADAEIKTVSGNAILRGGGKPISVRASTVSGDIRLDGGAGELEATTVSGNLTAAIQPASNIRIRTTSGDVTMNGKLQKNASVDAESISGRLEILMAAEAGYRYEANAFTGDIENCFDAEAESASRYGPGKRLTGTRGEGKGELRLKSMSGDMDICDR